MPRHGLKLPFRSATVRELAIEALRIAEAGLRRRARLGPEGGDEAVFIEPLIELALANTTPAEQKLALFHGRWGGTVDPVFREYAY